MEMMNHFKNLYLLYIQLRIYLFINNFSLYY